MFLIVSDGLACVTSPVLLHTRRPNPVRNVHSTNRFTSSVGTAMEVACRRFALREDPRIQLRMMFICIRDLSFHLMTRTMTSVGHRHPMADANDQSVSSSVGSLNSCHLHKTWTSDGVLVVC